MTPITLCVIDPPRIRKEKRFGYWLDWIGGTALAAMFLAWSLAT